MDKTCCECLRQAVRRVEWLEVDMPAKTWDPQGIRNRRKAWASLSQQNVGNKVWECANLD